MRAIGTLIALSIMGLGNGSAFANAFQFSSYRLGMSNNEAAKVTPLEDCKDFGRTIRCKGGFFDDGEWSRAVSLTFDKASKRLVELEAFVLSEKDPEKITRKLTELGVSKCDPKLQIGSFDDGECFGRPRNFRHIISLSPGPRKKWQGKWLPQYRVFMQSGSGRAKWYFEERPRELAKEAKLQAFQQGR